MDEQILKFTRAIADDTRQRIMALLCCRWLNVSDIVEQLGGKVKQPTVSHHLKLLEDADLVHVRQEGRQHFYTLNQQRVTFCCGQLMQQFAPDYCDTVINLDAIEVQKNGS